MNEPRTHGRTCPCSTCRAEFACDCTEETMCQCCQSELADRLMAEAVAERTWMEQRDAEAANWPSGAEIEAAQDPTPSEAWDSIPF